MSTAQEEIWAATRYAGSAEWEQIRTTEALCEMIDALRARVARLEAKLGLQSPKEEGEV